MRLRTVLLLVLLFSTYLGPAAQAQAPVATALVDGNTTFALQLYEVLRQETDENLVFSPYSVSQALAMTYAGARGQTAVQMEETLAFGLPQADVANVFGTLNSSLAARGNGGGANELELPRELNVANGLWGEQTFPFDPEYSVLLEQAYGAGLQPTDFINAPEAAEDEINAWVAEQTKDRIQNIVPKGSIGSDTPMVLANAIYFYGSWQDPFDPGTTSDDVFTLLDGTTVTTPFMVQRTYLPYAQGDGFQIIEFPYSGDFTFTIILPDEGQFDAVEQGLTAGKFNLAFEQPNSTDVLVHLPRFEFEFGTELVPTLTSLGISDAFDSSLADFTGMVDEKSPVPICIGNVAHKAFISVDEAGTEAAAATVVLPMAGGSGGPQPEPLEVRIDRPFLFAIRDTVTGTVLFLGRVMNPRS